MAEPHEESLPEGARTIILALLADAPEGLAKRQGRKFVEHLNMLCGAPQEMRVIVEVLGFDPTNHHNAAVCPYCTPTPKQFEFR